MTDRKLSAIETSGRTTDLKDSSSRQKATAATTASTSGVRALNWLALS